MTRKNLAVEIVIISPGRCSDLFGLISLLYAVSTWEAGIVYFVSFVVDCCIKNLVNSVFEFIANQPE